MELGHGENPPLLYDLLNYNTVTRNSNDIPCLGMVRPHIDSATRTFGRRQHQHAERQRVKLGQLQHNLNNDERNSGKLSARVEQMDDASRSTVTQVCGIELSGR